MYSWTINEKEYHAPMGYGEITLGRFATYQKLIVPLSPDYVEPINKPQSKGIVGRVISRLRRAKAKIEAKNIDELDKYEREIVFQTAFVAHWLKCDDVIDSMGFNDISSIYRFLNLQWQAWGPTEGIERFMHDGKLWEIDYSLDTLAAIKDINDLQSVMSAILSTNGRKKNARYWGKLSLDIASSVMREIQVRHKQIGDIVGASILEAFNLK